jgi:hypothetical protein
MTYVEVNIVIQKVQISNFKSAGGEIDKKIFQN